MSTYYFIVCDKHKERSDAASRTAGGYCPLANGPATLIPFIIAHHGCPVRVVSEHEPESWEGEYREWTEETVQDEVARAVEDGRWG